MTMLIVFVLVGISLSAIIYINFAAVTEGASKTTTGYADWMHTELDKQFTELSELQCLLIIVASTVGGGMIGYVMYPSFITVVPLALVGLYAPRYWVKKRAEKRKDRFNDQLVDALVLMSNSLRSGLSLLQSIRIVVSEMAAPMSEEFGLVLKEQRVSAQLNEALLNLNERIESEDLDMVVTSVLTLRETGGNLAETFDTVTYTIRERKKVEDKIKSLTAQGYMQGIFACLSPVAFVVLMYFLQPQIVMPLFTTTIGWGLIALATVLDLLGFFVLKKLVTIKV